MVQEQEAEKSDARVREAGGCMGKLLGALRAGNPGSSQALPSEDAWVPSDHHTLQGSTGDGETHGVEGQACSSVGPSGTPVLRGGRAQTP